MSRIAATIWTPAYNQRNTMKNNAERPPAGIIRRIHEAFRFSPEAYKALGIVSIHSIYRDNDGAPLVPKQSLSSYPVAHPQTESTASEAASVRLFTNKQSDTPFGRRNLAVSLCSEDSTSGGSASPPEPPDPTGSTQMVDENQILVDQLVNAAEWGQITPVINILNQYGTTLLKAHHSNTGNTALHAAIFHDQPNVVGAIIQAITLKKTEGMNLVSLLTAENHDKETPLQRLPNNPVMRHELLAGLSSLWPFCRAHWNFTDFRVILECGCRVCHHCMPANIKDDPKCKRCTQTLGEGLWETDSTLTETRKHVFNYACLFKEAGLQSCTHCQSFPAFPPYKAECGHTFCKSCISSVDGKSCPGYTNDDQACQQPLTNCFHDTIAANRFIRLFSSISPYLQSQVEHLQQSQNAPGAKLTICSMDLVPKPGHTDISASVIFPMPSPELVVATATSVQGDAHYTRRSADIKDTAIADNRHYKKYSGLDSKRIDELERRDYRIRIGDKAREQTPELLDSALKRARIQQQQELALKDYLLKSCIFGQAPTYQYEFKSKDPNQGAIQLLGTMFDYLTLKTSSTVGIAQSKGRKKEKPMEDKYIAKTFPINVAGETILIDIVGVFDGHGKPQFAEYAVNKIIHYITQRLEEFIHKYGFTDYAIREALKIAFVDTSRTCHRTGCGTTANIALFIKDTLWVINTGDSRALWVDKDGNVTQLSEDAKPDMPYYTKSIEARGGEVVQDDRGLSRVNKRLATARSLGDHDLNGAVSARPTVIRMSLNGISGLLVQVTDGVTDVAPTQVLGTEAHNLHFKKGNAAAMISVKLIIKAYISGSQDHLTAVVTLLDAYSKRDKPSLKHPHYH